MEDPYKARYDVMSILKFKKLTFERKFKMQRFFCLIILLFFNFVFFNIPVFSENDNELESMLRESRTRAILVKNVQKAVVHIKVEKIMDPSGSQYLNNPLDLYNDEFFRRFFPDLRPPRNQKPKRNQNPKKQFRQEGMGSGSIVDREGYILTNHHVVGEADRILVVLFDGTEKEAKLVGTDPESDIAVIKIKGNDLSVLPMGNSDDILVGEDVIAVGNPFGLIQTVTYGIVSAKGRSNVGINEYENFIQTDAAINPGNSGGPLVSLRGEIVGVNSAIFSRSGGYQGIGFAVPINMARKIMFDLIEKGTVSRGWLGVGIQDVSKDLAKAFKLENTKGSLITGVMEDTPAQKAGIRKGDVVIKINEKLILDSNHLRNEIANAGAFEEVEMEIIRDGESIVFKLELGERPKKISQVKIIPKSDKTNDQFDILGMTVEEINKENSRKFKTILKSGLIIVEVDPLSPAAKTGISPGMVIQEVERQVVGNIKSLRKIVNDIDLDQGILILVSNKNGSRYIFLQSD